MNDAADRSFEPDPRLRSCPFCGLAAELIEAEDGYPTPGWTVECEQSYTDDGGAVPRIQCFGYRSQHAWPTKAEAAAAWNKRAFE
jgi:hypothetical protein